MSDYTNMLTIMNEFEAEPSLINAERVMHYRNNASAKAIYGEAIKTAERMTKGKRESNDYLSWVADMEETGGQAVISEGGERHAQRIAKKGR